jgi:hypothetical protein
MNEMDSYIEITNQKLIDAAVRVAMDPEGHVSITKGCSSVGAPVGEVSASLHLIDGKSSKIQVADWSEPDYPCYYEVPMCDLPRSAQRLARALAQ